MSECEFMFLRHFTYFQFAEEEIPPDLRNIDLYPAVVLHSNERTVSICIQDCTKWGIAASPQGQQMSQISKNPVLVCLLVFLLNSTHIS